MHMKRTADSLFGDDYRWLILRAVKNQIPLASIGDAQGSKVRVWLEDSAGDAFNGGFAYALAEGMKLAEAVSYGSATAAISVTRLGTAPAMPYKTEIKELLDSEKN